MNFQETIGIDVSKPYVDAFIHCKKKHKRFKNSRIGFNEMLQWVDKNLENEMSEKLFAFEHTGLYSIPLSIFLTEKKINYILIPGLELKRSLGLVRGKDDKVDARFIALYAYRRRDEITPYNLPSNQLLVLRRLLSLREKLVKQRTGYKSTNSEIKDFLTKKEHMLYFRVHDDMINFLNKQIDLVDKQLLKIIKEDEQLKQMYQLITSIKGVGQQTGLYMITYTNGFTLFANYRKFASYAGIAPFPNRSGISIRGKTKVSHLANKKFKSLLSNCAVNAIITNPEMRLYYQKRINNGKNKMSTINIVRNKILARIFAVVARGTEYVNTFSYAS